MNKNVILCRVFKLERIVLRQAGEYLYCHAVNIWLDITTDKFDPRFHFVLWNFPSVFFTVFRLSVKYKYRERTDKLLCHKCGTAREKFWPLFSQEVMVESEVKSDMQVLFPNLSEYPSHIYLQPQSS